MELRHLHFAGASLRLTRAMDEFAQKHKAAGGYGKNKGGNAGGATGGGNATLDMRGMRSLVQSLPQYRRAPFPTRAASGNLLTQVSPDPRNLSRALRQRMASVWEERSGRASTHHGAFTCWGLAHLDVMVQVSKVMCKGRW